MSSSTGEPVPATEAEAPSHREPPGYSQVRGLIRRAIGSFSRYEDLDTLYDPDGRDILDYGWAGDGDRALALLERGARSVAGLDLWWKQDDLDRIRGRMREAGVESRTDFRIADP